MQEHDILSSQYHAALAMLKQSISVCPETLWNRQADRTPFWQIAYHTLFYTHLYLQENAQTFQPWSGHREEYHLRNDAPVIEPPGKTALLEYLAFCQQEVVQQMTNVKLDATSGFDWLPFSKLELHIYTIRHIQQHIGELMERLAANTDLTLDWVGARPPNSSQ